MATSREASVEPAATQADTSFSESIASSATRHHDQPGPSAAPAIASGAQTPSSTAADDRPSLNSFSSASTLESEQMFVRPSKLNSEQRKLVSNMQKSRGRTSIFVPLLFFCASVPHEAFRCLCCPDATPSCHLARLANSFLALARALQSKGITTTNSLRSLLEQPWRASGSLAGKCSIAQHQLVFH